MWAHTAFCSNSSKSGAAAKSATDDDDGDGVHNGIYDEND